MVDSGDENDDVSWSMLGPRARAWRLAHAAWSIVELTALGYVWGCAINRRRDAALWASVGLLVIEGGALAVGRGDCPMGRLQEEWGDPVPFFELVLPPRAAKAAVPVLAVVTVTGIAGVFLRSPGLVRSTTPRRGGRHRRAADGD